MGYLLKEALKTICGVKQWDYAVFWKIGCPNPKFETNLVPSGGEWEGCLTSIPRLHAFEKIKFLVDTMMIKNKIILMGEGMIGQAAITGSHQWILSGSLSGDSQPPEVLSQLHNQFSAGMQTITVIPVKPHGVVQLGSALALMENVGFVDEVRSLILQLGVVPGPLLSDSYLVRDAVPPSLPMPPSDMPRTYNCMNLNDLAGVSLSSGLAISHLGHVHDTRMANRMMRSDVVQDKAISPESRPRVIFQSVPGLSGVNGFHDTITVKKKKLLSGAVTRSSDCDYPRMSNKVVPSQLSADGPVAFDVQKFLESVPLLEGIQLFDGINRIPSSTLDKGASSLNGIDSTCFTENLVHLDGIPLLQVNNPANNMIDIRSCMSVPSKVDNGGLKGALKTKLDNFPLREQTPGRGAVSEQFDGGNNSAFAMSTNHKYGEQSFVCSLGDDLFDVLGRDCKWGTIDPHLENVITNESEVRTKKWDMHASNYGKTAETISDYFSVRDDGMSESCAFEGSGADNLLDAIVSGSSLKQYSDDNVSSKAILPKTSCFSVPGSSLTYTHFAPNNNRHHGGSIELTRPLEKSATSVSCSDMSGHSKEKTCTQSNNSLCGSQISSWVEQCHVMKQENSVLSGYSKRPGGKTMKPNRKRLKPGENLRPRPKDRQMIQDRLKELRELVPTGSKCSIDALLERTIKHMLFLQSVTKHADKLKLTGETKIRDMEGGLLLKDNFEGGATWAFEVGSHSMICPIIVEDLNSPRQMLVEMLCQERGLFLEIADAIRGLGLTILKGVMEARDNKIWAQFAVEANRGVTRMEIFMSLVHLLERTGKNSPGCTNAMEGDQTIQHSLATGV